MAGPTEARIGDLLARRSFDKRAPMTANPMTAEENQELSSAQDRHPPSVDQTSLDPVAGAVERLSTYAAGGVCGPIAEQRVDLRALLAAYAEMKEGLAVAQESGSRPGQDELRREYSPSMDREVLHDWARDMIRATNLSSQTPAPVDESRETIKDLRSKLDLAVKALEPFAQCAERLKGPDEQTLFGWTDIHMVTLGDFRLARSALTEMRKT